MIKYVVCKEVRVQGNIGITYDTPGGKMPVTKRCTWQGATLLDGWDAGVKVAKKNADASKPGNVHYYAQMVRVIDG